MKVPRIVVFLSILLLLGSGVSTMINYNYLDTIPLNGDEDTLSKTQTPIQKESLEVKFQVTERNISQLSYDLLWDYAESGALCHVICTWGDFMPNPLLVEFDNDENLFVAGNFKYNLTLGNLPTITCGEWNSSKSCIFIAKIDSLGNWMWSEAISSSEVPFMSPRLEFMKADSDGGVIIAGEGVGGAIGNHSLDEEDFGIFISSISSEGSLEWMELVTTDSGFAPVSSLTSLDIDSNDSIILSGIFAGERIGVCDCRGEYNITFGDSHVLSNNATTTYFVAKMSNDGDWQWVEEIYHGTPLVWGSAPFSLSVDSGGNSLIAGIINPNNSLLALGQLPTLYCDSCLVVAKISPSGEWLWSISSGSNQSTTSKLVTSVDGYGNLYISGDISLQYNNLSVGNLPTLAQNNSSTGYVSFIIKVTYDGSWHWLETLIGDYTCYGYKTKVAAMGADSNGNLVVVGQFPSGSTCNPPQHPEGCELTLGDITIYSGYSDYLPFTNSEARCSVSIFVAKISDSGSWLWASTIRPQGWLPHTGPSNNWASDNAWAHSVTIDSFDNVYIGGKWTGTNITFGESTILESSGSGTDYIIARLVSDIDGDGVSDLDDIFPEDSFESADFDGDGIGDNADQDDDNDGWLDSTEMGCLSNPMDSISIPDDLDGDLICDNFDDDDDGDGWSDHSEFICGTSSMDSDSIPSDNDGDWSCDLHDWDDDNDSVIDLNDIDPMDPCLGFDTDGDGLSDHLGNTTLSGNECNASEYAIDEDDDGDTWTDADEDACVTDSLDYTSIPADLDGDLICDIVDTDDDDDGVADETDAWPRDNCVAFDTDSDGLPDFVIDDCQTNLSADDDDDGDSVLDVDDFCSPGEIGWISGAAIGTDHDGDGCRDDGEDADDDGDGIEDAYDNCPRGHTGWSSNPVNDIDGDGCHETEDYDTDGDGFSDTEDSFPEDPMEWHDSDGDGVGDNSDSFPEDPMEWHDSDGDGVGDNSDSYPNDSSRWEIVGEVPSEVDDGYFTIMMLVGMIIILIIALVAVLKRK